MVFISEAQPEVVFLVLLWICKFSFQGSPAALTYIWEQLESRGPWAEEPGGAPAKPRWGHTCQPRAPGHRVLTEGTPAPPPHSDPSNLCIFVCDEEEKQKSHSEKTTCFPAVFTQ